MHEDTGVVAEQSEGDAFGRLILLFDPEGDEAWNGTMRLVAYIQADLDAAVASDPPSFPRWRGAGSSTHSSRATNRSTRSVGR